MNKKAKKSGLGAISTLTLIFIVLKLLGVIKWSWIWVLCPAWGTVAFFSILFSIILVGGRIAKGKW